MDEQEFLKESIVALRTLAVLLITGAFGVCSYMISRLNDTLTLKQSLIISGAGLLILATFLLFTIWHLIKMVNKLRRK